MKRSELSLFQRIKYKGDIWVIAAFPKDKRYVLIWKPRQNTNSPIASARGKIKRITINRLQPVKE